MEQGLKAEGFVGELESLRSQAKYMEQVIDVLPSGLVVIDGNGVVIEANRIAKDLLDEPLIGQLWFNVIKRAFSPREDDGHEVSLNDGRRIQLKISALEGQPGQLILMTDLSETRELQDRLSKLKRLSALGKMVASLAHQIRTPLSAAMLYGANLANKTLPETSRQSFQQKLMSRLQDLETQVNDMLLFARSGEKQVVAEVSLQSLLREVKAGSEVLVERASGRVEVELPEPDLLIMANRNALASAIGNLIHNATQACGPGAYIRISAKRSGANDVELSVTDNGPGIPKSNFEKVMEPFYTSRSQGTGLGLAVVQSVAKAHQGRVELSSILGKGACFKLILPLHKVASPRAMVVGE